MTLLWAGLIVVGVTAVAIGAILFVRRSAPGGSYFEDGDRAAGVFGSPSRPWTAVAPSAAAPPGLTGWTGGVFITAGGVAVNRIGYAIRESSHAATPALFHQ